MKLSGQLRSTFVKQELHISLQLVHNNVLIVRSDEAQANRYKNFFGTCCETPQSQVIA